MKRRLPLLVPESLTAPQRQLYERLTGGRRGPAGLGLRLAHEDGSLTGPFNAMLYSVAVGDALQELGTAVRLDTTLTPRCREIAILSVAALVDCRYEIQQHEAPARRAGLDERELRAVLASDERALADPGEQAVVRLVRTLVRVGDLDDVEYAEHVERIGSAQLFELIALVGYYRLLATVLAVFRVPTTPATATPAQAVPAAETV